MQSPADGPTHLVGIRRTARLSQEQLAHGAGVSLRTLRNIELGAVTRPHQDTLRRIAGMLGLDVPDTETFVGFWHPRPPSGEVDVPDLLRPSIENYLTPEQLRTKHDWTALAKHSHDVYGSHRVMTRSDTDEIVRADRDDVRHATLLLQGKPGLEDYRGTRVTGSRNCAVVGETLIPDFTAKVFDIEFAVTLSRGDVFRWGVAVEYGIPDAVPTDETGGVGFGVTRAGPSLTQEVSFADGMRPARLHYTWSSHAMRGRELQRDALELNRLGGVMFHLTAAPVGVHKIVWQW